MAIKEKDDEDKGAPLGGTRRAEISGRACALRTTSPMAISWERSDGKNKKRKKSLFYDSSNSIAKYTGGRDQLYERKKGI